MVSGVCSTVSAPNARISVRCVSCPRKCERCATLRRSVIVKTEPNLSGTVHVLKPSVAAHQGQAWGSRRSMRVLSPRRGAEGFH